MNKKILISLSVIAVVAVIAIGGTIAYFSDTETSTGNTFMAGTLDLKVDNTCHYNGMVCSEQGYWEEEECGSSTYKELIGQPCTCTWVAKDLNGDLFFNFTDIKPGDYGENTISLHADYNDAYVCAIIDGLTNYENDCSEPESKVDLTCGEPNTTGKGSGRIQDYIRLQIWRDNGVGEPGQIIGSCDNVYQQGEIILVEDTVINNNSGAWELYSPALGALKGDTTECIGIAWSVPGETGNIIQGDELVANISFYAEQARNNGDFRCVPVSQRELISTESTTWPAFTNSWQTDARWGDGGTTAMQNEIRIGLNGSTPIVQTHTDNTTGLWRNNVVEDFTLVYNGSGDATFTVGDKTINTTSAGLLIGGTNLGLTVKLNTGVTVD
jgi:predicted ribosomally synthesized peptide with SipW-like signal peptide